uniref:Reverse transcriptase domain-containing protein n=1 Tax=Rhabditophanes sp. KR3021 TaxID=114890 RepID=A0AC35TKY5_9BILA
MDSVICVKQTGFRSGYCTADNIIALRLLLQKSYEYKIDIHLVFLDFKKAFDIISRKHLWMALRHYNVNEEFIQVIVELYENSRLTYQYMGKEFEMVSNCSVKQGGCLSPRLFTLLIQFVLDHADLSNLGFPLNDRSKMKPANIRLDYLAYADDIVFVAESTSNLQLMLDRFTEVASKATIDAVKPLAETNKAQKEELIKIEQEKEMLATENSALLSENMNLRDQLTAKIECLTSENKILKKQVEADERLITSLQQTVKEYEKKEKRKEKKEHLLLLQKYHLEDNLVGLNKQYDRLRNAFTEIGYNIFPCPLKMNAFKRGMENGIIKKQIFTNAKEEEIPSAYVTNVVELLTKRINDLYKSNKLSLSRNAVDICLIGDKGSTTTKLGLSVKLHEVTNSLHNTSLVVIYYGDDNYSNMSVCFKPIAEQLEMFTEVEIDGQLYPVNLHLNGDYKFTCSALGHTGAASRYPCIKCIV